MAESGLSIGFPDLLSATGSYLGYGTDYDSWSAARLAEVSGIVQSGVRRVYYPPAVNAGTVGYEWSWLRPTATLSIEDGTSDYDLPDDFGCIVGGVHYPEDEFRNAVRIVSVSKILELRATIGTAASHGYPELAATRYKTSDGSSGQRQEILFYPTPGYNLDMSYEYEAYSGALSETYPYPLGGMQLAELYIESCLAVAESRLNDEIGIHTQQYQTLLIDAIERDKARQRVHFGNMGCSGNARREEFRRGLVPFTMTYNGELIE
jgi:hypothetical protein